MTVPDSTVCSYCKNSKPYCQCRSFTLNPPYASGLKCSTCLSEIKIEYDIIYYQTVYTHKIQDEVKTTIIHDEYIIKLTPIEYSLVFAFHFPTTQKIYDVKIPVLNSPLATSTNSTSIDTVSMPVDVITLTVYTQSIEPEVSISSQSLTPEETLDYLDTLGITVIEQAAKQAG